MGADLILVDCDGDAEPLIPLWLEGGVTGLWPVERAAGMDAVACASAMAASCA